MAKKAKGDLTQTAFLKLDDVPPAVKAAATRYKKACLEKAAANEAVKAKKDALMTSMRDNGVDRVKVELEEGRYKVYHLSQEDKLSEETVSDPDPVAADDAEE